jgi:hypothetical protein
MEQKQAGARLLPRATPLPLLAGAVVAFVCCCVAGFVVSRFNIYPGFVRFHPQMAPESQYFPTVSQVRALVKDSVRSDQILVIVGGNSIFYGVSQPVDQVWTRRLQEHLGDRYKVINLAMRGAGPTEFGAIVAESLLEEHPRLIYVADVGPGSMPIEPHTYGYFFWDAYYKGLLPHDPVREGLVKQWRRGHRHNSAFAELRTRLWVDSYLYTADLWTAVTFHHFSAVWCPMVRQTPFRPRVRYADHEPNGLPFEVGYPAHKLEKELSIVRGWLRNEPDLVKPEPGKRSRYQEMVCKGFTEAMRPHTLILVMRESPYYLDKLTADERARYDALFPASVAALREVGVEAREAGKGGTFEDYSDRCHLSVSGGRRLADTVAGGVKDVARRLGYDADEQGR